MYARFGQGTLMKSFYEQPSLVRVSWKVKNESAWYCRRLYVHRVRLKVNVAAVRQRIGNRGDGNKDDKV